MLVSERELAAIRRSFELAEAAREFDRSPLFYQHFFRRAPEKRAMFRDDLAGQGMKFMGTLRTLVGGLSEPATVDTTLKPLAQGHAALGVAPADFEPMREALIDTFRDVLGEEFTPEMEAAWRAAFDRFSQRMIEIGGMR